MEEEIFAIDGEYEEFTDGVTVSRWVFIGIWVRNAQVYIITCYEQSYVISKGIFTNVFEKNLFELILLALPINRYFTYKTTKPLWLSLWKHQ